VAYSNELVHYESLLPDLKAKAEQPQPPDMPEPSIEPARPIPAWAAEAQKQFDGKWK